MKPVKILFLFFLLHCFAWGGTHLYLSGSPEKILVVVDTSYSMKKKFPQVERWIKSFHGSARYKEISIGTDKALIGNIDDLNSYNDIFRTSFGRFKLESLNKYSSSPDKRFFLSDISSAPEGWELVSF